MKRLMTKTLGLLFFASVFSSHSYAGNLLDCWTEYIYVDVLNQQGEIIDRLLVGSETHCLLSITSTQQFQFTRITGGGGGTGNNGQKPDHPCDGSPAPKNEPAEEPDKVEAQIK